ncbi:MAG: hypothetical protein PUH24_05770 [Prevotellaceae bacterium]|nr:hypothetical protein [Prevotella sp.]MDD7257762.1 hypothetical protein [Prevotellaceae bacterium]MDY6130503.1 hypothetical protein [Prevotella sp.]
MKKKYESPKIVVIVCVQENFLLTGSDANNISGIIHSGGEGEYIWSGDEDDEGGVEASAKEVLFLDE